MAVTYRIAVDLDDDDDFSDVFEDITHFVERARWRLGMARPFDTMMDRNWCELELHRALPGFSLTDFRKGLGVQIWSDDGSSQREHWNGHIADVVVRGRKDFREIVIRAEGPYQQMQTPITLALGEDVRADEVIQAAAWSLELRRDNLQGHWLVGLTDQSEMGTNTRLADDPIDLLLEAGESTFEFFGDTFGPGWAAWDVIAAAVASERGRCFLDRRGRLTCYNRHHLMLDKFSTVTIKDDQIGYEYHRGDVVRNWVEVEMIPRSLGTPESVVWSVGRPQRMKRRDQTVTQIRVVWRDSADQVFGALNVLDPVAGVDYTAFRNEAGTGPDETVDVRMWLTEVGFSGAVVNLRNLSKRELWIHGLQVRGDPVIREDPARAVARDPASEALYGPLYEQINLPFLTSFEEAFDIASFELSRRANLRGRLASVVLSVINDETAVLARTLFERVTIEEGETGINSEYVIVAEEHEVARGKHEVTWLLEEADANAYFVVGSAILGTDTYLVF